MNFIADRNNPNSATNDIFLNTSSNSYWSSTPYIKRSTQAWNIGFHNGSSSYFEAKEHQYNVRCVRDVP